MLMKASFLPPVRCQPSLYGAGVVQPTPQRAYNQCRGCFYESILAQTDPYICKAANIAPLQYVYDVLHPWFYMGHEFGERLRRKGIALLHSDQAGKMLGFECSSFMLQAVAKAVADAKKFREEAGL